MDKLVQEWNLIIPNGMLIQQTVFLCLLYKRNTARRAFQYLHIRVGQLGVQLEKSQI